MELLKTWVLRIVGSSLVGVIVLVISPNGSVEKAIKTAVSLFIMCSFVSPFISFSDVNLSGLDEIVTIAYEDEKGDEILMEKMRTDLISRIREVLSQQNIFPESIDIKIRRNESAEIIIDRVLVTIHQDYLDSAANLKSVVYSELGLNIDVEVKDEK